jgi:histidyl-tRNA synthetase
MASQKPSIPSGTRDFSPEQMVRRNYIFDTIRSVFKKFGFLPIETPAMENIETLTGKYGEEGDQLLFKILNSRPYEANDDKKAKMREAFERSLAQNSNSSILTERALRYDLTVPFARYVVQHQSEITFPFRRYQIQPVWRADRPQKGRYREFFQCDADVIGSDSLINEVELVQMIDEVFHVFRVPVLIKINNRKILCGIADVLGETARMMEITMAIDKLDKVGVEGVNKELRERGISDSAIEKLQPLLTFSGNMEAKLNLIGDMLKGNAIGEKGIEELNFVLNTIHSTGLQTAQVELDITLARGLNYYTGAIFEVKALAGTLSSSICGGGRYDDLTGVFGLKGMSGVGISFGIDRIFDVLNEVGYPEDVMQKEGTRILIANFGGEDEAHAVRLVKQLRDAGVASEVYPDVVKMGKQFKYADARSIPFVAMLGAEERAKNVIAVKNLSTGEQSLLTLSQLIEVLK